MGQADRSGMEALRSANARLIASRLFDHLVAETDRKKWLFVIEDFREKTTPGNLQAALAHMAHDRILPKEVTCFASFCLDFQQAAS